LYVYFALFVE
jgi:hypothetical protein